MVSIRSSGQIPSQMPEIKKDSVRLMGDALKNLDDAYYQDFTNPEVIRRVADYIFRHGQSLNRSELAQISYNIDMQIGALQKKVFRLSNFFLSFFRKDPKRDILQTMNALESLINSKIYEQDTIQNSNNVGDNLQKKKNYEAAIKQYEMTLKIAPKNIYANLSIVMTLAHQRKYDDAMTKILEVLKFGSRNANVISIYATVLTLKGRYDEANAQFEKALQMYPQYVDCMIDYGHCLTDQKKYAQALAVWEKAEKIRPDREGLSTYIQEVREKLQQQSKSQ